MLTLMTYLMLAGCPDPTTAADLGNPGPGGAAPGNPGASGENIPQGPPPAPGSFEMEPGAGVTISGTLRYTGEAKGVVRIDVLRKEGDSPPQLLHVEKVDAADAFTIQAPPNTGPVSLVAFIDVANDGPSASDPAGRADVNIEEAALTDVRIDLSDEPELGDLTPGDAPTDVVATEQDGAAPTNPEIPREVAADAVETPDAAVAPADKTEPSPDASE